MNVEKEMERLKELGQIDGVLGAKKVGMVLDLHNQNVDKKKEKEFNNNISDRNQYYWKLWRRAAEELDSGAKPVPKEYRQPKRIYIS